MARRDLIQLLATVRSQKLSLRAYRSASPGYSPLSGEGARLIGGRWNPPNSFPVLYAASDVGAAAWEVFRTARRYDLEAAQLLPRILWTIEIQLERVLDFTDAAVRDAAHLPIPVITDDDIRLCQAYGDAAHYLGIEGILAPSNAGAGSTVAVFINRLGSQSSARVVANEILDRGDIT
jgi:RES domain-containing protein